MSKNTIYNYDDPLKVEYKLVDGEVKKIVAMPVYTYSFDSYDDKGIDDPLLQKWIATEEAQYIIKHSVKRPTIHKHRDVGTYDECCKVVAYMYEEHAVFYTLKWK
jgi:hypothetical protein